MLIFIPIGVSQSCSFHLFIICFLIPHMREMELTPFHYVDLRFAWCLIFIPIGVFQTCSFHLFKFSILVSVIFVSTSVFQLSSQRDVFPDIRDLFISGWCGLLRTWLFHPNKLSLTYLLLDSWFEWNPHRFIHPLFANDSLWGFHLFNVLNIANTSSPRQWH